MKNPLLVFLLTWPAFVFAQSPFSRTYYNGNEVTSNSVIEAFDGGYIVAGYYNYGDGFLMKLDAAGLIIWSKSYAGCRFNSIARTSDSSYVMTGTIPNPSTSTLNVVGMKVDLTGVPLWTSVINSLNVECGINIEQTNDNGFILTGYHYSTSSPDYTILIARLDSLGALQWKKTIPLRNNTNIGYVAKQTPEGGFLAVAFASDYPPYVPSAALIKLDSAGTILWAKTYTGPSFQYVNGYDVEITPTGYLLYGSYGNDALIVKTDLSGTMVWSKAYYSFSSSPGLNQPSPKLCKTFSGDYIFVTGGMNSETRLHRIDAVGNEEFQAYVQMSSIDLLEDSFGEILILGNGPLFGVTPPGPGTEPHTGIVKTDSMGVGVMCIGMSSSGNYSPAITAAAVVPTVLSGGTSSAMFPAVSTISISTDPGCVPFYGGLNEVDLAESITVFPNPFGAETTIRFEEEQQEIEYTLSDVPGKIILLNKSAATKEIALYGTQLQNGIYFLSIRTENGFARKKLIITH